MFRRIHLARTGYVDPLTTVEKIKVKQGLQRILGEYSGHTSVPVEAFGLKNARLPVKLALQMGEYIESGEAQPKQGKVPLAKLLATQNTVSVAGLRKYIAGEPMIYPKITLYQGKQYIPDGHHRICVLLLAGRDVSPVFAWPWSPAALAA